MSKIWKDLRLDLNEDLDAKVKSLHPQFSHYRILRRSVDARKRHDLHEVITLEIFDSGETPVQDTLELEKIGAGKTDGRHGDRDRPLIIGSGPAGLFCALRLVERGIPCVILERGSHAEKRILGINAFWRYGKLDPRNNVCFGEGGAGLYSDGKLITRIKSPHIPYVLNRLIRFGAPAEIEFLSNPHVGSDRIRRVIPKLRQYLLDNGCEIKFETTMTDLIIENQRVAGVRAEGPGGACEWRSSQVVLATGHSAEDIFHVLRRHEVAMEGKSFAIGLRVEHPQAMINDIQYRQHVAHPRLGSANYKLTHHDAQSGIGVYSFCMCPGGYVLSSGTEAGGVVSNGMSNYHRNSPFANAAVVVSVDFEKRFGGGLGGKSAALFAGLEFRRELEERAYGAVQAAGGTRELPVQNVVAFMNGKLGEAIQTSCPSGVKAVRLDQILPTDIVQKLREGLKSFDQKMKGFIGASGQLHGVETRTSCPIRVTRDGASLQSISHLGLYPAGEGAGYAGGITSAAVDGIRIAEAITDQWRSDVPNSPVIHRRDDAAESALGWQEQS